MVVPPYLPDNRVVRSDLARFCQSVLDLDTAVGTALATLDASGAAPDTLVIFTTDHGFGFPRAKATLYDPGIHIPLIMHWPGVADGGRTCDCLISNTDVVPTLADICGFPVPDDLDGRSFAAAVRGGQQVGRNAVTGGLFYDVAYDPMHYVRTRTHKYMRSFAVTETDAAGADPEVLSDFTAGQWIRVEDYDVMSGSAWQSMASPQPKPPVEELYDLTSDPWEQHNLMDVPGHECVLEDMRARLGRFMAESQSPLTTGHVPPTPRQRELGRKHWPGGPKYQDLGRR